MTLYDFVLEAKRVGEEKRLAERREHRMTRPVVTDHSLVREFYDCFILQSGGRPPGYDDRMYQRRVFILMMVRLYSPVTLAGGRFDGALRKEIANIFGCSPSAVSHMYSDISFLLKNMRKFRETAENAFKLLIQEKNITL